jgi:hypothetical protein
VSILRRSVIFVCVAVALGLPLVSAYTTEGRIKVIFTGRVIEGFLINSFFRNEPMVDPLFVPTRDAPGGTSEMQRFVRVYFPRNYEAVKDYDFVIFAGTVMTFFSPIQQKWMHDAIFEGAGGINSRSLLSGIYWPEWVNSATQRAFPNDADALAVSGEIHRSGKSLEIILEEREDLPRVLTMFLGKPVMWRLQDYSCGLVIPREGATVWSWIKGPFADRASATPTCSGCSPHLISWQYGEGITWTCHDRLINWWQDPIANPYGLDMIMNMILVSNRRELPGDIDVIHDIRSRIAEFKTRQILVLATVEFGEKFGANMDPIFESMKGINEKRREADGLYLAQEYLLARAGYLDAISDLEDLNYEAMERKDRAMVWVYLVQWFVVSGTAMLAGMVVWTLMVRRRLYREVTVTRFSGLE